MHGSILFLLRENKSRCYSVLYRGDIEHSRRSMSNNLDQEDSTTRLSYKSEIYNETNVIRLFTTAT